MRELLTALVAGLAALLPAPAVTPVAPEPAAGPADTTGRVQRAFPVRVRSDYSSAHHDYPATDLFAACGARAFSPVDGVVLELGRTDRWDPASDHGWQRGGRFVSVRGDDGVRYYLSHFAGVRAEIRAGDRVHAGQHIAWVGRSGSARGTPCHIHVGLSPVCRGTGQWRVRRGVVSPYPYLRSWESGGNRSPAAAVAAWKARHGCR